MWQRLFLFCFVCGVGFCLFVLQERGKEMELGGGEVDTGEGRGR